MLAPVPARYDVWSFMIDGPYARQLEDPAVLVPPPELDSLASDLVRGAGCLLLGGRGMGKSVAVRELESRLQVRGDLRVARFSAPPVTGDVRGLLHQLARGLDVPFDADATLGEVLEASDRRHGSRRKVLLYDEADQLGHMAVPGTRETLGARWTRVLESERKERGDLGVLLAGGPGLLGIGTPPIGSPFLQRAEVHFRQVFDVAALASLCAPFEEVGRPWSVAALQTLAIATGGVPALATFVLDQLWSLDEPLAPELVSVAAATFRQRHPEFLAHARTVLDDPLLDGAPRRLLDAIVEGPGALTRGRLRSIVPQGSALAPERLVQVLVALGLSRLASPTTVDPLEVWATVNPLHPLPEPAPVGDSTLQVQLRGDLEPALRDIYRASADFRTRSGGIVEEKVLCAVLAMTLAARGWLWEREVQEAAGRTDLRLHHPRFPGESALVEVKYWGRNDWAQIHEQVVAYTRSDTTAWAAVTVHPAGARAAAPDYEGTCLAERSFEPLPTSLLGAWQVPVRVAEGQEGVADHFLVRLATR